MATDTQFQDRKASTTITIDSGSVTSSAAVLIGTSLAGMILPAGFQGATVDMQGGTDGSTWFNLYSAGGTQFQVSAGASRYIYFAPTDFVATQHVRVISASTQTASRTITLVSAAQ